MIRTKPPVKPSKPKPKGKPGRIGSYRDEFLRQAYLLARMGATDVWIAEFFDVDVSTVDYWKKNKSDFRSALKKGKWEWDFKAVDSLTRRVTGYEDTETEISERVNLLGQKIKLRKVTTKYVPPDVRAIMYWLSNRQKSLWADVTHKTDVKVEGEITHQHKQTEDFSNVPGLTAEEQKLLRSACIKKLASVNGISSN